MSADFTPPAAQPGAVNPGLTVYHLQLSENTLFLVVVVVDHHRSLLGDLTSNNGVAEKPPSPHRGSAPRTSRDHGGVGRPEVGLRHAVRRRNVSDAHVESLFFYFTSQVSALNQCYNVKYDNWLK